MCWSWLELRDDLIRMSQGAALFIRRDGVHVENGGGIGWVVTSHMEGEEGSKTESPKHGRRSTTIKGLKRNSMVNTNEERRDVAWIESVTYAILHVLRRNEKHYLTFYFHIYILFFFLSFST